MWYPSLVSEVMSKHILLNILFLSCNWLSFAKQILVLILESKDWDINPSKVFTRKHPTNISTINLIFKKNKQSRPLLAIVKSIGLRALLLHSYIHLSYRFLCKEFDLTAKKEKKKKNRVVNRSQTVIPQQNDWLPLPRAEITCPNVTRDLFMSALSFNLPPTVRVGSTFSLPARSTRWILLTVSYNGSASHHTCPRKQKRQYHRRIYFRIQVISQTEKMKACEK